MKMYLAAQFARRAELAVYAKALEEAGVEVTSEWLAQQSPQDGAMSHHTADENRTYAQNDLIDVDRADAVLFFSEDPTVGIPRGGRHVEFGYALARDKAVWVVGGRENVFHWTLPDSAFFTSFSSFLAARPWEAK
jgi:nucleoside 2-deoxyribosyltransferase